MLNSSLLEFSTTYLSKIDMIPNLRILFNNYCICVRFIKTVKLVSYEFFIL